MFFCFKTATKNFDIKTMQRLSAFYNFSEYLIIPGALKNDGNDLFCQMFVDFIIMLQNRTLMTLNA